MDVFPGWLKYAVVIPLHKKVDVSNMANYRPISLLPLFSKDFEKTIYYRFNPHLQANSILLNNTDSGKVFQLNTLLSHLQVIY